MGWRVDYILSSSLLRSVEEPMVHLQLKVANAPDAPAQPVAISLSADKFQVLLAATYLFPCRTEAGPDLDELPELRRRVFVAHMELPYLCRVAALETSGLQFQNPEGLAYWISGFLGSYSRIQHRDPGDFSSIVFPPP
uniref:COMM domain containing 4 n=1 Tax=Molossus molossus TaxID=27622 RepID=A0A7J8JSW3_MOLMO|nr:COMM domain containing 4 [Molossus molossus]